MTPARADDVGVFAKWIKASLHVLLSRDEPSDDKAAAGLVMRVLDLLKTSLGAEVSAEDAMMSDYSIIRQCRKSGCSRRCGTGGWSCTSERLVLRVFDKQCWSTTRGTVVGQQGDVGRRRIGPARETDERGR